MSIRLVSRADFECRQIALGRLRPCHGSAGRVRAFAHGVPADIVGQQCGDLRANGFRIAERNQNAAPVIQQFPGVPVGCRDDGLSQSKAVGQRAGRHLGFIEIGRRVDVAHRDEVQQRGLVDELVEEDDMVLDAEFPHPRRQALSVGLTLSANQIWMGRAENDIDGVRAGFDDRRHGIDHSLDAFARRQQAEREDDGLPAEPELGLGVMRLEKGKVGDSVRDHLNLLR